jgi:excisionase family DNA binding protein
LSFACKSHNTYPIGHKLDIYMFRFRGEVVELVSEQEVLLTPSEVASLFRVDPKTVTRWAKAGKLTSIRTLGGHRRYKESEVKALLSENNNLSNGGN